MEQVSQNIDEKYNAYFAGLTELIQFLEGGNMDAYFAQPTQGMQNALGSALGVYASSELYHTAFAAGQKITSFAKWQGHSALALVIVLVAAWYGIRQMIVQPLAIISSHFDKLRKVTWRVRWRCSVERNFRSGASLKAMQGSLRETVSDVRQGSYAMHTGISEIAAGNNDLSSRTEQQAASLAQTAASMEQLTATVSQNADNARQASDLSKQAAMTAKKGGDQADGVASTMHEIATSSRKLVTSSA
jgi:methyl-accepting chemotaxis protein-2 (aspartate sensor receptor)